jgi:hypothetical protein
MGVTVQRVHAMQRRTAFSGHENRPGTEFW